MGCGRYVPSDADSFARLIKPSLKAQAQALDVAKVPFTIHLAVSWHGGLA